MSLTVGGTGGGGGGGGGGSGFTLPSASVPNSVLKIHVDGTTVAEPVAGDEVGPVFNVGFAGARSVDLGQVVTSPSFTASANVTPLVSAVLTNTSGHDSPINVLSTPFAFTLTGLSFTVTSYIRFTYSAQAAGTPMRSTYVDFTPYPRVGWGVAAPGGGAVDVLGVATSNSNATIVANIQAILAQHSQLAGGRGGLFAVAPSGAQKAYFASPSAYNAGIAFQFVGNLPGGVSKVASAINMPNAYGVVTPMDFFETNQLGVGGTLQVT